MDPGTAPSSRIRPILSSEPDPHLATGSSVFNRHELWWRVKIEKGTNCQKKRNRLSKRKEEQIVGKKRNRLSKKKEEQIVKKKEEQMVKKKEEQIVGT